MVMLEISRHINAASIPGNTRGLQCFPSKASWNMRVLQWMETIQVRKAHTGAPCYEANQAHGSLVYSGAAANTKIHTAQQNILAITTGSSNEQTDLITQLPSTLYKQNYRLGSQSL